ncbi:unnamed protein product [Caenorhabditis auriculariae]|uniref:Uncharacterized protein n=1 Tax=Caenorhabditis auriculariae TaxID=2777116 RepID=A0A8S1H7X4_9PELO|nr:unnamed protein product [Caenorhabditis auriculariae]
MDAARKRPFDEPIDARPAKIPEEADSEETVAKIVNAIFGNTALGPRALGAVIEQLQLDNAQKAETERLLANLSKAPAKPPVSAAGAPPVANFAQPQPYPGMMMTPIAMLQLQMAQNFQNNQQAYQMSLKEAVLRGQVPPNAVPQHVEQQKIPALAAAPQIFPPAGPQMNPVPMPHQRGPRSVPQQRPGQPPIMQMGGVPPNGHPMNMFNPMVTVQMPVVSQAQLKHHEHFHLNAQAEFYRQRLREVEQLMKQNEESSKVKNQQEPKKNEVVNLDPKPMQTLKPMLLHPMIRPLPAQQNQQGVIFSAPNFVQHHVPQPLMAQQQRPQSFQNPHPMQFPTQNQILSQTPSPSFTQQTPKNTEARPENFLNRPIPIRQPVILENVPSSLEKLQESSRILTPPQGDLSPAVHHQQPDENQNSRCSSKTVVGQAEDLPMTEVNDSEDVNVVDVEEEDERDSANNWSVVTIALPTRLHKNCDCFKTLSH